MDVGRLRNIPVFAGMSDADLRRIATFATEDSAPEGTTLVREGDYSTELIAIEEGTAEVRQSDRALATLGPGDVFGETGVLERGMRESNARTDVAAAAGLPQDHATSSPSSPQDRTPRIDHTARPPSTTQRHPRQPPNGDVHRWLTPPSRERAHRLRARLRLELDLGGATAHGEGDDEAHCGGNVLR